MLTRRLYTVERKTCGPVTITAKLCARHLGYTSGVVRVLVILSSIVCSLQAQSLQQAISDIEAGRLENAEQGLTKFLGAHPDSEEALFYMGLLHFRAGRPAAARPYLDRAVKLSPTSAPAWKVLGLVTAAGGNLQEALTPFRKACQLAPRDEEACYYFARNLYALHRYDLACEPFAQALRAAPEGMRSKVDRAAALNLEALGRSAEAERHFREAVRLHRDDGRPDEDPHIDYGAFLFRQGRTAEALRTLEKAAAALASSSRANTELGRVLLELGRPDAAAVQLERAIGLERGNWTARLLLGRAYLRLGRKEEGDEQMRLGQEGWAREHYDSSIVK